MTDNFNVDRREIARLLGPIYPTMAEATSNEWHFFLNAETGLDVPLDEPNGSAFDKWRQALASKGVAGVWGYTPDQIEAMKARGKELSAKAAKWRAENGISTEV